MTTIRLLALPRTGPSAEITDACTAYSPAGSSQVEDREIWTVLAVKLSLTAPIERTGIDDERQETIVGMTFDHDLNGDVRGLEGCGRRDPDVGDAAMADAGAEIQEQYRTE